MAYMADMDHPYITLDNDYIETGWWILKKSLRYGTDLRGSQDPAVLPALPETGSGLP